MAGKNIGILFKSKPDGKSIASGYLDLMGVSLRIVVMPNDRKGQQYGGNFDYSIVSYGIAEAKQDGAAQQATGAPAPATPANPAGDGLPF